MAKNHNFGQILTFGGLLYRPPITDESQSGVLQLTHIRRLRVKICLDRFILSRSGGENPQFLPFFGLWHLVMSTVGGNLRKLNTGAQLQTTNLPLSNDIKIISVLRLQGDIKCTNSDVQKRDGQTKKLKVFLRPGGG